MAPESLALKIKQDIEKSGFPLEMHVLNVCSTKNTGRMPSLRYEYQDAVRELDLFAFFEEISFEKSLVGTPQHTKTDLIIECKKSAEKPWVFFSSPLYKFDDVTSFLRYTSDLDVFFTKYGFPPLLAQIHAQILNSRSHYADPAISRCVAYYEAFKGPSQSEIYKAIDSVLTYLRYKSERRSNRREEYGVLSDFYLPVVVLDGRLFEASLHESEFNIKEKSHVQLRTWHREDLYIVDVVTRDHFRNFLNKVEQFHKDLVSAICHLQLPAYFRASALAKHEALMKSAEVDGSVIMALQRSKQRTQAQRARKRKPRR